MVTPTSPEITIRSKEATDEKISTPGTIRDHSPEIIRQSDRSYDGTDTYHDMQSDADTSVEQLNATPTNPRSSEYDLRHNPKPNYNDNYSIDSVPEPSTEGIRTLSGNPRNVL